MARCTVCRCNLEGVEDASGNLRHAAALDIVAYKKCSGAGRGYYICTECERARIVRQRK